MPLNIPGYYYDPQKKKYFKIEKSQTAPATAAYSADAVKRRKVEASAERAARRREWEVRKHVKRHVLRKEPVTWGLLGRETGDVLGGCGDVGAAGWGEGVVRKGRISFGATGGTRWVGENVPRLWVGGGDGGGKTGLGVAYTTVNQESLVGSYVPTDADGRISFEQDAPQGSGRNPGQFVESVRCPQMSSIRYHAPSHRILLTSMEPDHSCGLYLFSPAIAEEDDYRPHWLLGQTNLYQRLSMRHRRQGEWYVHSSTPAPPSSDLICVMGTNAGVVRVSSNETMALVAPQPTSHHQSPPLAPKEIFELDFQNGNHNVIFAGGRQHRLWMSDLRASETSWTYVKHASSIPHLRSVNEHQVLVYGLESSMALYDVRFLAQRPNGARPLVTFPGHRNRAHTHVGFDVCPELGTVAAAQDDGTVGIFSLYSGRRVRCPAVDRIDMGSPVKALMFGDTAWERTPSLWVGEGRGITKYSFGRGV